MNRRLRTLPLAALAALSVLFIAAAAFAQEAQGSDTSAFSRFADRGIFVALGASFGFGVLNSLTPCVFPMVPVTLAIFGATEAKSRLRAAALCGSFVLGMALLFTTIGVMSALGGAMMGGLLGKAWVVITISIVFLVLASSMFGAFELTLPSSVNNRLSSVGGIGFKGAFVIGLVMGLVAMPCTGPFMIGMALWIASTKSVVLGASTMFFFALGLGQIFVLAGAFAMSLPKAGAWMMGIKWVSGVVLAYMSLAYLRDRFQIVGSLVSPTMAYGLAAIALLAVGVALGVTHIAAERRKSSIAHLSKPTKLASILPAVLGGFMFASWLLSAPASSHESAVVATKEGPAAAAAAAEIAWHKTESEGLARATAEKKPVLIDFGAEWCKACKELERDTFPDTRVRSEASRFIAIHVDATDDDDENIKAVEKKYKVVGLPTVVLLDSKGNEAARFNEFVEPVKFADALKKID